MCFLSNREFSNLYITRSEIKDTSKNTSRILGGSHLDIFSTQKYAKSTSS